MRTPNVPPAPHYPVGVLAAAQAHPLAAAVLLAAMVGVVAVWRGSRRKAKRVAAQAREATRVVSLAGRMLLMAGVIVGGQWVVFTHTHGTTARAVVLGLPALFAAHTLTRAVTVTGTTTTTRRGGAR